MSQTKLLENLQILYGPNQLAVKDSVLISDDTLVAFGEEAHKQASQLGITSTPSSGKLLAPSLVDPHSILEEPLTGRSETLFSLIRAAAASGYGQLALLPRSSSWRDNPERLKGFSNKKSDVLIHLWGSFSRLGQGKELAPHADLLQHGAIGLAEDDSMLPIDLLQRGLLLGEMGQSPVLLAPRDKQVQASGTVREGVETLRAGWVPDPITSETLPLGNLLELQRQYPESSLRVMNISTKDGVKMMSQCNSPPMSTVCWWHLVSDRGSMSTSDLGWRIVPSIGGKSDRQALIKALRDEVITAVAVHATPLDEEETQLPPQERIPGLSGHQLVLPVLWKELIIKAGFSIEQLWNVLSFGPSKILNLPHEKLSIGSKRWILFDPEQSWIQKRKDKNAPNAANQPFEDCELTGKIIDCGLKSF